LRLGTDVSVPISTLAARVGETHADIESTALGSWRAVQGFLDPLVDRAVRMDGTCSVEHGVGRRFRYLAQEHGAGVEVMLAIKKALDPLNILNPGKIFALP